MSEHRSRPGQRPLDRVLEELTAAPLGDLRARVLARIGSGDVVRSPRVNPWRVALPVAAAVAAVTWTIVWRERSPSIPPAGPQREPAVSEVPPVQPEPTVSASESPATSVARRAASSRRSARRAPAGSAGVANVTGPVPVFVTADDAPALPSLTPPPPVRASEITVPSIGEPAAIEVPALRVEPLSSPGLPGSGMP